MRDIMMLPIITRVSPGTVSGNVPGGGALAVFVMVPSRCPPSDMPVAQVWSSSSLSCSRVVEVATRRAELTRRSAHRGAPSAHAPMRASKLTTASGFGRTAASMPRTSTGAGGGSTRHSPKGATGSPGQRGFSTVGNWCFGRMTADGTRSRRHHPRSCRRPATDAHASSRLAKSHVTRTAG